MVLKNARLWVDAPLRQITVNTSLLFFLALLSRWALDSVLTPYLSVQFFLLGALFVAAWYGYVPALVFLTLGWAVGLYFFVAPYGELSAIRKFDVVLTLNYFLTGASGIAMLETLQRLRCSTRLSLAVSESRYRSLARLDNHRLHQQRQSSRALRQVSDIFLHLDRGLLLINQDGQFFPLPLLAEMIGNLNENSSASWLAIVHADDRPRIETEIGAVVTGSFDSVALHFQLATNGDKNTELDCVFRSLTVSAHKHVFALLLKPATRA